MLPNLQKSKAFFPCEYYIKLLNSFVTNALFPYPLKTSKNLTVGRKRVVEKGCIGNKWVNFAKGITCTFVFLKNFPLLQIYICEYLKGCLLITNFEALRSVNVKTFAPSISCSMRVSEQVYSMPQHIST